MGPDATIKSPGGDQSYRGPPPCSLFQTRHPRSAARAVKAGRTAANSGSKRSSAAAAPVYCVCRTSDTRRFMIACDACQEWFHGDCVGVSPVDAGRINGEAFRCPACSGRRRSQRQPKRRRAFGDDDPPPAKLASAHQQPPPRPAEAEPVIVADASGDEGISEDEAAEPAEDDSAHMMLLPAEDESATDDEMETAGGYRPPTAEEDSDAEAAADRDRAANSLLDEDDFASTSVFRFPKRCGYCDSCRLRVDCGRCEVCQAKKRYPNLRLDKAVCLARLCRTMARLGGSAAAAAFGVAPFIIQKRGRGRPSKAYALPYSDHSYCRHHCGSSWQTSESPLPVSRLTASPSSVGHLQQQQHQAYYTLNEDTDNLQVTWPEESA
uniref:PHD-type domain-containing protein n=1 Tax=Macrostomum lignano TaxID=282301 RepID=A0A1I8G7L5_9PLAT